jgi:hypothetical protein
MTPADDDDWVGEPPEGRHSARRADPGFWRRQWQFTAASAVLGAVIIIAALVILLT